MELRTLGGSGFKVPALSLGTGTFGGHGEFFKAWGGSGGEETADQVARLDAASATTPVYPYWHQRAEFADRNPPPVT